MTGIWGWETYFSCGLIGALLGALVALAVAHRHLSKMAVQHRVELERQHHVLRTSFLQLLHDQVTEHRTKAAVRLLNAIFSHLSDSCLPLYAEGQALCGNWRARSADADREEVQSQLQGFHEHVSGAIAGFARLINQNRNQDEIYREFQNYAGQEARLLRSISTVTQQLERVAQDEDELVLVGLDSRFAELDSAVADFGKWIKLSMKKAARMQEALIVTESDAEIDLIV